MEIFEEFEEFISRYLNPLTDFGFHKIFGNKDLLIDFLNGVMREEGLITDIQYLPPEQWGDLETERKAIFDIFCITEKGDYFIVEMQRAKQAFFRERSIYYASLPIQKQAQRGIWNFQLKAVYIVAILDFVLFDEQEGDKEQVVEYVHLMRERTKTLYSDKLRFAFVELPKFRKTEEELENHFDEWLFILKNLSRLKDRPVTIQGRIFEKLFQLAEIKRLTKEDMETYRKSILEYHDVRSAVDYAREEGIEEGREEGREEEKIIVIQRCLQKNMSIDDIIYLTGFSKEQIIRYKESDIL
ncbi:MAG: Rpn family recombination-promoting nuclease/putative transposase [Candidatus Azobacteroides sp.]|nr:Rpn family recombination-promoting nuclease/putative transposase [Candidatus Azobacteroides sp.]